MERFLNKHVVNRQSITLIQKEIRGRRNHIPGYWLKTIKEDVASDYPLWPIEKINHRAAEIMKFDNSIFYGELTLFDIPATCSLSIAVFKTVSFVGDEDAFKERFLRLAEKLPKKGVFEFSRFLPDAAHGLMSVDSEDFPKQYAELTMNADSGFTKDALVFTEDRIGVQSVNRLSDSDASETSRFVDEIVTGPVVYLRDKGVFRNRSTMGDDIDKASLGVIYLLMEMALFYMEHAKDVPGVVEKMVGASNRQSSKGRIKIPAYRTVSIDLSGEKKPARAISRVVHEVIRRQGVKEHEVSLHWRHFGGDLKCEHRFEAVEADDGIARQKCVKCGMRRSKIRPFRRGNPELGVAVRVTKVTDSRRTK